MIVAEVEGVGRLEFPPNTRPEVVQATVKRVVSQMRQKRLKESNPTEYDPESAAYQAKYGPTASGGSNFAAGIGKGVADLELGARQLLGKIGLVTNPEDFASRKRGTLDADLTEQATAKRNLDAPLMQTSGGKWGGVTGAVLTGLPAVAIPGANTLAGAGVIGAGYGALQPAESGGERLKNTAVGGVLSPLGVLGGRALAAGYRGAKALVEPLTEAGQQRIAQRTLQAFAGGEKAAKDAAAAIARNSQDVLPGVAPTTAELAENAGLAQLQRSLRNNPELLTSLAEREAANRTAVIGAVEGIAGDDVAMAAARQARTAGAKPLYEAATQATARADGELGKLMARPSMAAAWNKARDLASEAGDVLPDAPDMSGTSLHYLKMAMDDLADNPAASGFAGNQARSVKATRDAFLGWLEKNIPEYQAARTGYAELSRPINQMEVGQAFRDKLIPALGDAGQMTRLRPEQFAQALRNGDAVAQKVTGFSGAKLEKILTPEQIKTLRQVSQQLARTANANDLGRAVGSNTGQNLVSQNIMRQFLGPLGLPESTMQRAAESTLMQSTILRPAQWAGKLGEQRAITKLAEAALDPKKAQAMLEAGVDPQLIGALRYQGLLGPAVVTGSNSGK